MPPKDKLQYHIQAKKGDVGRYVLLPGDPDRCEKIAAYFDNPKFISRHREYVIYTGTLLGEQVSVCSTGIGCPSTAIAVEELIAVGADTFIRVGTAGGIQDGTRSGEVAVVTGAIRDEGTTRHYLPIEFPAIADPDVVTALRDAASEIRHSPPLRHHPVKGFILRGDRTETDANRRSADRALESLEGRRGDLFRNGICSHLHIVVHLS